MNLRKRITTYLSTMLVIGLFVFLTSALPAYAETFTYEGSVYDTASAESTKSRDGLSYYRFKTKDGAPLIYINGSMTSNSYSYCKVLKEFYPEIDSVFHIYFNCKLKGAVNTSEKYIDRYYIGNAVAIEFGNKFDTSEVTSMKQMFYNCTSLKKLDISKLNTGKVTNMSEMFKGCYSLTELDLSTMNTAKVTDMHDMFYDCYNLTSVNLSSFNTKKVTDLSGMFYFCSNLKELNISKFNTSNVTDMSYMFSFCRGLSELNVSTFNTSKVTNMKTMFQCCEGLTQLDVSNFNTSSVTNMGAMFGHCTKLLDLDLSKFDTSKVTNMDGMFQCCESLTSLDLKNFDTSNVTVMSFMFSSCVKLSDLNTRSFNTSKVTDMSYMFQTCNALTSLYVGNFDTTSLKDAKSMFFLSDNLTKLILSPGFKDSTLYSTLGINQKAKVIFADECIHDSLISIFTEEYLKTPATCTKPAVYYFACEYCYAKSDSTYSYGEALGHKETTVKTPASTKKDGSIITKCSRCDKEISRKVINRAYVTVAKTATHTGKAIKPTVTVSDVNGKKISTDNYTITYKNNTKVGKASVTVTFKNNYKGSNTYSFEIVPKAAAISGIKTSSGAITVSWKKVSTDFTGYQLQYAKSKDFKTEAKTVTVKSTTATSKKITKLTSKKTYYVRIRTYKTLSGSNYYSAWSEAVKIKVK